MLFKNERIFFPKRLIIKINLRPFLSHFVVYINKNYEEKFPDYITYNRIRVCVITNPVVGSFQMTNYTFISDDLNENLYINIQCISCRRVVVFFIFILYSIMKL